MKDWKLLLFRSNHIFQIQSARHTIDSPNIILESCWSNCNLTHLLHQWRFRRGWVSNTKCHWHHYIPFCISRSTHLILDFDSVSENTIWHDLILLCDSGALPCLMIYKYLPPEGTGVCGRRTHWSFGASSSATLSPQSLRGQSDIWNAVSYERWKWPRRLHIWSFEPGFPSVHRHRCSFLGRGSSKSSTILYLIAVSMLTL